MREIHFLTSIDLKLQLATYLLPDISQILYYIILTFLLLEL